LRVWDIPPPFLNRGSLLGEHREIHGIFNILTLGKKGYSRHPETLRWEGCLNALAMRHDMVASEMVLRGYNHLSPLPKDSSDLKWPDTYIDPPQKQYELLKDKYLFKVDGPIPIPLDSRDLWGTHKFSVLARDERFYRETGPRVAGMSEGLDGGLASDLVKLLRLPPSHGGIENALDHMWGFLKGSVNTEEKSSVAEARDKGPAAFLGEIRRLSEHHGTNYLLQSTALYELNFFLDDNHEAKNKRR